MRAQMIPFSSFLPPSGSSRLEKKLFLSRHQGDLFLLHSLKPLESIVSANQVGDRSKGHFHSEIGRKNK